MNTKPSVTSIKELTKYIWTPHHSDTSGWLCEIHFEDEYAIYFFNGQCAYYFFTYTTYAPAQQQVRLLWTYKTDCISDLAFLERSNGIKNCPKSGDEFSKYTLLNDTTIAVEYMFPEWVKTVNLIAKDSLFPQRLYLKSFL